MTPTRAELARLVDHTRLAPTATLDEVHALLTEAQELGTYSICVSPSMLPLPWPTGAVLVATVCGFPSGKHTPHTKAAEAAESVANGADEVDMVIDLGRLKAGDAAHTQDEIRRVREAVDAAASGRRPVLKVIIESAALTDDEIMNFQWINPSTYHHPVNFAALGLSYSFFPTFCSGERTAAEVREVVSRWAIPSLANRARISSSEVGIDTSRPVAHSDLDEPVVLYPAITMDARKQPAEFHKIVAAVAKRTPIRVIARLAPSALTSTPALQLATERWSKVTPLRATADDYWTELSHTTAFVATATEEAYGLVYVEAMRAGAIGILPNRPWARKLVPDTYPYLYNTAPEAEEMLYEAVTNPQLASDKVDEAVGGGHFTTWIREHHDRSRFDQAFKAKVREWFGA